MTDDVMTARDLAEPLGGDPIADRESAEGFIGKICFKTGPPSRAGIELEWTVHHHDDPARPLDPAVLAAALGEHAPPTLQPGSRHEPLASGAVITVEPGGQVEISTPPYESMAELVAATTNDIGQLTNLLDRSGLRLGDAGCDPYRPPRRLLHTPRYAAMERAFDQIGPHGRAMMCGTAGLQVCLDIGTSDRAAARWQTIHDLGPLMIAIFANSARFAGAHTGWASHRMNVWYGTDPVRTRPPPRTAEPLRAYAARVLDTPLLCRRTDGGDCWDAPAGVTFADWIRGALDLPPNHDDLRFHLSTVFPPVRARGYLEVRYLDTQPGDSWLVPLALLGALFADEQTVDAAAELAAPVADRWVSAARYGLHDPAIHHAARQLPALAQRALDHTDLSPATITTVMAGLTERIETGGADR